METIKIRPVSGRTVRDPVKGDLLPESGRTVENSVFWRRRLRDGDIELIKTDTSGD